MTAFELIAALLTLAAAAAWVNHKLLRLPMTIGIMLLSLGGSLALVLAGLFEPRIAAEAARILTRIDFNETLMHGMLGFLLFAGALHVNLADLMRQKWIVALLATAGILVSTAVAAAMAWVIFNAVLGLGVPPIYCLLFGALISPTDPIAVLGILRQLGAPKTLETKITGESLFNDGVGVVLFLVILGIATGGGGHGGGDAITLAGALELFAIEALGGAAFGFAAGGLAYLMLRSVNNYTVEILISLALVAGGYALSLHLHLSGPIAMVVAGLLIGNHGRSLAMSEATREHLDLFWELVDEVLNAVLFLLIGLEMLVLTFTGRYLVAGALAIPAVLFARLCAVGLPVAILRQYREFTPHAVKILAWGGLKGGLSVAMALSIPRAAEHADPAWRDAILTTTYMVVIFSIAVQGLSIGPLIRRWAPRAA